MAVAGGLLVDRVVGEPPAAVHPVALYGSAMAALERRGWRDDRAAGLRHVALGLLPVVVVARTASRLAGPTAALVGATATAAAGRALRRSARSVGAALESGDLEEARRRLPALVGRDPENLDESGVARAVVESVAENLSDAVVATALWGTVAGPAGVLAHRAANTLDAMVGHRSPRYRRFGWAAARLDDALGWPAARLSALCVALARPTAGAAALRTAARDGGRHPSPNAGVAEAAFAGSLGLQLGGPATYGGRPGDRPLLGRGRPVAPADIERAVVLADRAEWVVTALALVPAVVSVGLRLRRRGGAR
jgi:adenosylcobinamide-phosphate synthase